MEEDTHTHIHIHKYKTKKKKRENNCERERNWRFRNKRNLGKHLVAAELPLNRLATERDVLGKRIRGTFAKKLNAPRYFSRIYLPRGLYVYICSSIGMHNERYLSLLERPAAIGFHTKALFYFPHRFSPSFSHTHVKTNIQFKQLFRRVFLLETERLILFIV